MTFYYGVTNRSIMASLIVLLWRYKPLYYGVTTMMYRIFIPSHPQSHYTPDIHPIIIFIPSYPGYSSPRTSPPSYRVFIPLYPRYSSRGIQGIYFFLPRIIIFSCPSYSSFIIPRILYPCALDLYRKICPADKMHPF